LGLPSKADQGVRLKMNCFLMALKPHFAEEILNGKKDCEVRTYLGAINEGDVILVYSSKPVMAVTGYFIAEHTVVVKPNELINNLRTLCHKIPRDNEEFIQNNYLKSSRRILILKITKPKLFQNKISIEQLRKIDIAIPRSYARINAQTCKEIISTGRKL